MRVSDIIRRGILNRGTFVSPYYPFDLLGRHYTVELPLTTREWPGRVGAAGTLSIGSR